MLGLYVHIPFCHAKCHYCDFAAYPGREREIPRYLAALTKEWAQYRGQALDTVFFGGGTPTALSPAQWDRLLASLRENFILAPGLEMTVECNPESTTPEKLAALRAGGVNRLSFGLQAAQDRLLKTLGRLHSFDRFVEVFHLARARGFDNINIDLMYGLPGQTMADWRDTLTRAADLAPEHVSAYALTVEEGTVFDRRGVGTDGDLQADMYEAAADAMAAAGYEHYEISNFAKPGRACRHNLRYWRNLPCLAVGVGAAGYWQGRRRKNTEDIQTYVNAIETGASSVIEDDVLDEAAKEGENLMLGLRLSEGVAPGPRARAMHGEVLQKFESLGFLTSDGSRYYPTRRGWLLSNQLFQEFV